MKNLVLLAALIGCVFGQTQNLCGTRTNTDLIFVNDPSDGTAYLWCNFDSNQVLQSVHQGTCPDGFWFNPDPAIRACDALYTPPVICTDSDLDQAASIRVADASDTSCSNFFVCRDGVRQPTDFNCTAPLVFNRNFGFCTEERIAPCSGSGGGGNPPPSALCPEKGQFEDLRNNNCADFVICNENLEAIPESCPTPLQFNPATRGCQDASAREPACPFPATMAFGPNIPTPPLINVPTIEQKIRSRFANVFRN